MWVRGFTLILGLVCLSAGAAPWRSLELAKERRASLEMSESEFEAIRPKIKQHFLLRTTREFLQEAAALCWVYATINTIESHYLQHLPNSSLELNRAVMQYFNWEDRYRRKIFINDNNLYEGGTTLDAITMIRRRGLFANEDYRERPAENIPWNDPFKIEGTAVNQKLTSLYKSLNERIGKPPTVTHYEGIPVSPRTLAEIVLRNGDWAAYAPSLDGKMGYRKHWDPDARAETKAYFIPVRDFYRKIFISLRRGRALALSICGHDIMLFGGDFDANLQPLAYYIKDSNPGVFYKIDPRKIELGKNFCGVTTLKGDL